MAQHDQNVADGAGAVVRGDINDALAALWSLNSGATAPSVTTAYMWWVDTANGLLKQRNAANTGWINRADLTSAFLQLSGGSYPSGTGENIDLSGNAGLLALLGYPPAYIKGGVITPNAIDSNNDFDITACEARNSANTRNLSIAADTRQKDVIWSKAGPGGMAESGSTGNPVAVGAGATVHCFIIRETATGDLAYCLDIVFDGANILAGDATDGWTIERWVGARRMNGSGNIIAHTVSSETGNKYRVDYNVPISDVVDGLTTSPTTHVLSVPVGVSVKAIVDLFVSSATAAFYRLYRTDGANNSPSQLNAQVCTASSSSNNFVRLTILTDTSGQVKSYSSTGSVNSNINTAGYELIR